MVMVELAKLIFGMHFHFVFDQRVKLCLTLLRVELHRHLFLVVELLTPNFPFHWIYVHSHVAGLREKKEVKRHF